MYDISNLRRDLEELCPTLTDTERVKMVEQWHNYAQLLKQWNKRWRLVSDAQPNKVIKDHLLDGLIGWRCLLEQGWGDARAVGDIGSGAGIPGIPIALHSQSTKVALWEARQRRSDFLTELVWNLQITNCEVRPERLSPNPPSKPQTVGELPLNHYVARAWLPPVAAAQYMEKVLPQGGQLALWVGPKAYDSTSTTSCTYNGTDDFPQHSKKGYSKKWRRMSLTLFESVFSPASHEDSKRAILILERTEN